MLADGLEAAGLPKGLFQIVNGGSDVARGVETLVGGSQVAGLADDGDAAFTDNIAKQVIVWGRIISRDRFQFVKSAAGMS